MKTLIAVVVAAALGACTTFEDPTIVLDLRVLAVQSEPPDQVIDVDPSQPITASDILAQLQRTEVCALVADPAQHRNLVWTMRVCVPGDDDRCDPKQPSFDVGSGLAGDPEEAEVAQPICATVFPDQRLLSVLVASLQGDVLQGLGGVDYIVQLQVGGETANRDLDLFAAKTVRVSPRIPQARTANTNPRIDFLDASLATSGLTAPNCRCTGCMEPLPVVSAGDIVTLFPVESAGIREAYVVPTLDGKSAMLTETMTYQWLAGQGSFSDATTGGGHDVLGNQSLLGSEWRAPRGLREETLVPVWMVQRDERLGVSWFQTCFRVLP